MKYSEKQEHAARVVAALEKVYPKTGCGLKYEGDPWKLLIMARVSAQCKDERVNVVCKGLFEKYPTPHALAAADLSDVEDILRPCGLYHVKAKDAIEGSAMLVRDFGGVLPDNMDDLLKFPGVGRKVANVLLGDIYNKPAIVVDTHCGRLSRRMGLVDNNITDPAKVESVLCSLIPPDKQTDFGHRMVEFGRQYCPARSPVCERCPIADICPKIGIGKE